MERFHQRLLLILRLLRICLLIAAHALCSVFRMFIIPKVLCSEGPVFRRSYVPKLRGSMFRRFYVPKVLCSEGSMFRRFYVPKVLCSEGSMFRRFYVPNVLCSEGSMFRRFYDPSFDLQDANGTFSSAPTINIATQVCYEFAYTFLTMPSVCIAPAH